MIKAVQINKTIGGNIYALRQLRGWSRNDLADKMGLTHQQIGKYEKAESGIKASRLMNLADIFNCDISYFFGEGTSRTPSNKTLGKWKMIKSFDSLSKEKQNILIRVLKELCKSDTSK
jgi:transcriptional regulator with XRE-family HTH domain